MKKQTGIWLDYEKATIITLDRDKYKLNTIESDIVFRERTDGETKKYGRFGDQSLSPEKHKERRIKEQTSKYLKNLLSEIKDVDELVLFGPANMKKELEKHILNDKTLASKLKTVVSADSMSENQMVAWVKKFYFNSKIIE
ncbi:MAG: hypothetical protein K8R68_11915 [Bacteroidales bacterium]|nr:hypothetical protein [Bacteroidales bacterium]